MRAQPRTIEFDSKRKQVGATFVEVLRIPQMAHGYGVVGVNFQTFEVAGGATVAFEVRFVIGYVEAASAAGVVPMAPLAAPINFTSLAERGSVIVVYARVTAGGTQAGVRASAVGQAL